MPEPKIPPCESQIYTVSICSNQLPEVERCLVETESKTKQPYHIEKLTEWHSFKNPFGGYETSSSHFAVIKQGFPNDIKNCAEDQVYDSFMSNNLNNVLECAIHLNRITGKLYAARRLTDNILFRDSYQVVRLEKVMPEIKGVVKSGSSGFQ